MTGRPASANRVALPAILADHWTTRSLTPVSAAGHRIRKQGSECARRELAASSIPVQCKTCKRMTATPTKTLKPTPPSVADDPRWARIVARDKTADGHLWYSVATTGVYCRPSCPSRIANPQNVQLHDRLESARATGFRPCRRCNPDGPSI